MTGDARVCDGGGTAFDDMWMSILASYICIVVVTNVRNIHTVAILVLEEHTSKKEQTKESMSKPISHSFCPEAVEAVETMRINLRATNTRVRVYTLDGIQIALSGVGEGCNRLTFPAHFDVGNLLDASAEHWIRYASAKEVDEETPSGFASTWWRPFKTFQPRSFVHQNGSLAYAGQPVGLYGDVLTALPQEPECMWEEKPCCDVDHIDTPPTPVSSNSSEV